MMTADIGFARNYARPDLRALETAVGGLRRRCAEAKSDAEAVAVVLEWNRLRASLDANRNVAEVRYMQNVNDVAAQSEREFWDTAAAMLRKLDVVYARALLESQHLTAIAEHFGEQLLRLKRCDSATFDPAIADALVEEARLVSQYTKLTARRSIEFLGEAHTMASVAKYFGDADCGIRLAAQTARESFLAENAAEFDGIFDRLVQLRHGMGSSLGLDSYTPLGYRLMQRIGYGPDEVAHFREQIREHFVPIATEIYERAAREIGVDHIVLHNEWTFDTHGSPTARGDATQVLEDVGHVFGKLHPCLGAFVGTLQQQGLIDIEPRDGKAPGGFCANFADTGMPFVFGQFDGSDENLRTVLHECGHAYQVYAARGLPAMEYGFPTYEACEVHSMGMELLTHPFMERFFADSDDAQRYRHAHLTRIATFLPYMALVDHFQHDVYAEPTLSPAQRNARWLELERSYMPWRRYGSQSDEAQSPDFPHLAQGTIWQRQSHIYTAPFYFIDYALAQVCALQIHMKADTNPQATLDAYLAMCAAGGSVCFADMLQVGGLESPFDATCLTAVANHLGQSL